MSSKVSPAADLLDPEIRVFVDAITRTYASFGEDPYRTVAERRRIAEKVRAPWARGGPVMASTEDLDVEGLRIRVHRPVDRRPLPAMLYIHGGGWMLFSIDTHDRLMREYAARAGIVVIGIDYRLAPEHPFPAALEDCAKVMAWLRPNATSLGIDPARVLVGGDSAGANLAVALCLTLRDIEESLPAAMLLNYGAFSPEHLPSYARYGGGEYLLGAAEMDWFWQNYTGAPALLQSGLVAPIDADLHDLPPAYLAVAECDILADCNHAFAARLAAAGVPVASVTYRGATHSFLEAVSVSSLAARALDDQARWMREMLKPGTPNEPAV